MFVLSLRGFGVFACAEAPFVIGSPRTDSVPSGWSTTYNQLEDISAPNRESTIEFAFPRSGSSDRPGSRSASYV